MEEAAAAAKGKLDRQRELNAQYEDTIAELSQDVSGLTASLQALRDDHSGLTALAEAQKAEIEGLQVLDPCDMYAKIVCIANL